ncbi:MAG: DUF6391 domain-containing protein [Chloroflexi bacterium]|nr:DUF6391 domain-containing protein [Chloroflexota bacterium]
MKELPLNWGLVSQVRRNHGLEHATINLLAKKYTDSSFAGYSDRKGFWIVGDISTDTLLETTQSALQRLKNGEKSLAIHTNCGTNYVTTGLLAAILVWVATFRNEKDIKKKIDRLPLLVMIIVGTMIAAQPLGPKVQEKVSTSGEPGRLKIKQIVRYERNGPVLHRILTSDAPLHIED